MARGQAFLTAADDGLKSLSPSSFAMVMATAALSLAAHVQGLTALAQTLGRLNIVFYLIFWTLVVWRMVRHPREVRNDLTDHLKSPGFFTMVAGTCTLGSQLLIQNQMVAVAWWLWGLGALLWVVFTYAVFSALTLKTVKPTLAHGISGSWLLAVVATQALAVLSALLAPELSEPLREGLEFSSLCLWLVGGVMYVWMISLIVYRYTFQPLTPGDLFPSYWINMGAMAISTLAGATLLLMGEGSVPLIRDLRPFITGVTILFWATGTWWIPMLVVLGVWRHGIRRFPFKYDMNFWGVVFPLAMYTLGTWQLITALELEFLRSIPSVGLYVALAAWLIVLVGMAGAVLRSLTGAASASADT